MVGSGMFGPDAMAVLSPGSVAGLVGLALFIGALLCFLLGLFELRLAWLIWRNEPNAVLDAPNGGWIELVGVVEADEETLISPFTNTECVAYEYEVERRRSSDNGNRWETVAAGKKAVPFRLADDTGNVLVEPAGADVRLTAESQLTVGGGEKPPVEIARFIEEDDRVDDQNRTVDLRFVELPIGSTQRFTEKRLDVGEGVHVLGTAWYDTTVSWAAGQINAAVGIDQSTLEFGRIRWYLHRLFGRPFLISDTDERGTVIRIGLKGLVLFAIGGIGLSLLALFVV